jgi:GNAT superfamily N-acetyltransferase
MSAIEAKPADAAPLGPMLARAFHDDPMFSWILPDASSRPAALSTFFGALARHVFLPIGTSVMLESHAGAALWLPPGVSTTRFLSSILVAPSIGWAFGTRLFTAIPLFAEMERAHPHEPHHYLGVLGIDPTEQGKGLSKLLLAPTLARADADGKPAYLETAKESNLAYYRRFGFEITREVRVKSAPPLWCMQRAPRAPL